MDKNVGSVDLDELRKAREELDKERGVETDPKMYDDYNPNRSTSLENSNSSEVGDLESNSYENTTNNSENLSNDIKSGENEKNDSHSLSDDYELAVDENLGKSDISNIDSSETNSEKNANQNVEKDLSKYDVFSAFEVKENAPHGASQGQTNSVLSESGNLKKSVETEENIKDVSSTSIDSTSSDEEKKIDEKLDKIDNADELENLLDSLLDDLDNEEKNQKSESVDVSENVKENTKSNEESNKISQEENSKSEKKDSSIDLWAMLNVDEDDKSPDAKKSETKNYGEENKPVDEVSDKIEQNNKEETDNLGDKKENEHYLTSIDIEPKFEKQEVNDDLKTNETESSMFDELKKDAKFSLLADKGSNNTTIEDIADKLDNSAKSEAKIVETQNVQDEKQVQSKNTKTERGSSSMDESGDVLDNSDAVRDVINELSDEDKNDETKEPSIKAKVLKNAESFDNDLDGIGEISAKVQDKDELDKEAIKSDNSEILNLNALNEEQDNLADEDNEEVEEKSESVKPKKKVVLENDNSEKETEVITDYNQLRDILQKELNETEDVEEEKKDDNGPKFTPIDDYKFINEIAADGFKNSDKFSYILGKNEDNETVYGNFKQHYNLAVFGKNESIVNSFLNSMMLSLCLKNSVHEVNFVMLDSNINSPFEVYNKSSYMFFNRIAKTNKEILDTLIEISKEVDDRYEKLAGIGVKNIEKYNESALSGGLTALPYIILVFNNYTSASQAPDSDRIDACLYQILKYGRIAGVYCVVAAKLEIETNQINYGLSSRIGFKSDEDSRFTVGVEGVEKLPDDSDAIFYNIATNKVEHIKTATVTDTELDLIIRDLEDWF